MTERGIVTDTDEYYRKMYSYARGGYQAKYDTGLLSAVEKL